MPHNGRFLHDERALEIITQRNALLSTLLTVYPTGLSARELYRILLGTAPTMDRQCFYKDLFYLAQKNLIEDCTGYAPNHADDRRWRLTAPGNEFANRLISDPALEP